MKKRYWKKVMVLGLTVSSALLFAGCGKGNEAAGTTAEQSSAANQATAEVAPESKTEESSAGIDGAAEKAYRFVFAEHVANVEEQAPLVYAVVQAYMKEHPNVTIELGAHTDRKGTDQYNERLAQRRAQSVVDYLIAGGIEAARLEAKGYGESVPKTINKKMAKQFDFLKEGDVLTEEFILALPPEQQEIADQINRRTEFKVLRTNYNLF